MTEPWTTPPTSTLDADREGKLHTLTVGPDDQLVVSLPAHTEPDQIRELHEWLRQRFGDRVTVIAGADQLAVVKATNESG